MSDAGLIDPPRVTIYSDGGADPNPGVGGWGVVLILEGTDKTRELSGFDPHTTNNRMELTAAIKALEALKTSCIVTFYTDSTYVQQGITEWMLKWAKNGWKRKGGEVQNVELWQRLAELIPEHEITWQWVKGHTGNQYNERADRLATSAIQEYYAQFKEGMEGEDETGFEAYLLVSSKGNSGIWGVVMRTPEGEERLLFAEEKTASSNRLDVMAAVQAVEYTPEGAFIRIHTLSDYLRNGATKWVKAWRSRGWTKKDGDPVANADLWQRLDRAMKDRRVEFPLRKFEDAQFEFEIASERLREEIERIRAYDDPQAFDDFNQA